MIFYRSSAVAGMLSVFLIQSSLADVQSTQQPGGKVDTVAAAIPGVHDFDFFVGRWRVHHRRLKERLVGSHEWIDFGGTTVTQTVLGGFGNIDDNVLELPGGAYRAVTLRSFDAKTNQWSIWWLDSRSPHGPLDPPVRGGFKHGVGTFYADDTLNGKPLRIRFVWSKITRNTCHWEQAFSADGGATWESNWEMDFTRET